MSKNNNNNNWNINCGLKLYGIARFASITNTIKIARKKTKRGPTLKISGIVQIDDIYAQKKHNKIIKVQSDPSQDFKVTHAHNLFDCQY